MRKAFLKRFFSFFFAISTFFSGLFGGLGKVAPDYPESWQSGIKNQREGYEFIMNKYDIVLSPEGNDSNPGTLEKPMQTLPAAVKKLRALKNSDGAVGAVTVWMRGGVYSLTETINFGADDLPNITFKAYPDETPIISGGKSIGGWTQETVNGVKVWTTTANDDFNALYSETTSLKRTRYPESGYFYVDGIYEDEEIVSPHIDIFNSGISFKAASGDLKNFHNLNDVVVRILHYWKDEMVTVTGFDSETDKVNISRRTSMRIKTGDRYFLENVFEALNEPGEWYLDKALNKLYYVPQEGDDISSLRLYYSTLETFITIDGTDNIGFDGITIQSNEFKIPKNNSGMDDFSQAGYDAIPSVYVTNSNGFSLVGCRFLNIASCCVKLGVNVKNVVIKTNLFQNIGAQAVFIQGNNVQLDDPNITKNISITDNHIYSYGRTFFNSVGILIIHANSVTVANNEIHDGYYTAISVGWVWGYGYTVTDNNTIKDNLIYDIGQGWLSDMGGIYTLGMQPGTVLSGNVIYNVAADPEQGGYGGWGIYLDEGSSYITVEKNLAYRCGSQSFHQHYGKENIIRNNIFALSKDAQFRITRKEEHLSLHIYGNIFVSDNTAILCSVQEEQFDDKGNLFWDYTRSGFVVSSKSDTLKTRDTLDRSEMKRLGYYEDAVFADPLFKDIENNDFTLASNSPAITEIGFEVWNYTVAGTLTRIDTV